MNTKSTLLLAILCVTNIYVYSQNAIKHLSNIHLTNLGKIKKVELTDNATIFHITKMGFEDKSSFKLPENLFIWTELDSLQYGLKKIEGITYSEISINKGEQIDYQLFFEAIPKTNKLVQVAYYEDKNTIKGIKRKFIKISPLFPLRKFDSEASSDSIFSKLSFQKALKKAKKEDKKILLFFYDPYYNNELLKNYIFTNKDIRTKLQQNYIVLQMNMNRKEAQNLYNVYSRGKYPKLTILSSDGTLINNYSGSIKIKDFLRFIELEKIQEEEIFKIFTPKKVQFELGTRIMLMNSHISNYSSRVRTSVSSDIYLSTTFNGWYLFRTGLGFSSKGSCDTPINYLKMPLEFGVALRKGNLFDLPFTFRVIGGTYYAFRTNKNDLDVAKNDYGFRVALAPNVGIYSELSLSLYYDYGMIDLFKNIEGFQRNHSFGIGVNLTL